MGPTDRELKEQLAGGPLERSGFDERLRKRIEERLEERVDRRPMRWLKGTACGIALAALGFGVLMYGGWFPGGASYPAASEADSLNAQQTAHGSEASAKQETVEPQSALLIGLRTDHPASGGRTAYSSYRTVLAAPDQGVLSIAAEGEGIVMPVLTDFMKLVPVYSEDRTGEMVSLAASRARAGDLAPLAANSAASGLAPGSADAAPSGKGTLQANAPAFAEKLLFAGNRYVAVEQDVREKDGVKSYYWVKEIGQLNGEQRKLPVDPASEAHVSLEQAQGVKADGRNSRDQWTIVRQTGHWMGRTVESAAGRTGAADASSAVRLPESIVSYDAFPADWSPIRKLQPKAEDAFLSPGGDVLAVVTGQVLELYAFKDPSRTKAALTVNLQPGETVVMAQWATGDYVDMWKKQVSAIFNAPAKK